MRTTDPHSVPYSLSEGEWEINWLGWISNGKEERGEEERGEEDLFILYNVKKLLL